MAPAVGVGSRHTGETDNPTYVPRQVVHGVKIQVHSMTGPLTGTAPLDSERMILVAGGKSHLNREVPMACPRA